MQTALNPAELLYSIGIKEVSSAHPVAGGQATEIWRVESGGSAYALRIFRPKQQGIVELEAAAMEAAATAGIPIPLLHAQGEWNERPFMLLSWCPGQPLIQEALRRPGKLWALSVAAGRMQAQLHRVTAPEAVKQHRNWMEWGEQDPGLLAHLSVLASNREALLHGDYHPMNILTTGTGVSAVIDWTDACAGDPRADLARTMTLLLLTPFWRGWRRTLFHPIRRLIAAGWLRGYTAEAGPLVEMAPFYLWAGHVLRSDLAGKIGRPDLGLTQADLRPVDRWIAHWRRRCSYGPGSH